MRGKIQGLVTIFMVFCLFSEVTRAVQPNSLNSSETLSVFLPLKSTNSSNRAPSSQVQSLELKKVEINQREVSFRLNIQSDGVPVSVGILDQEKQFEGLEVVQEEGEFTLLDSDGEWLFSLELRTQDVDPLRDGLEVILKSPTRRDFLNSEIRELMFIRFEQGAWLTSNGHEGVVKGTFKEEVESSLQNLKVEDLSGHEYDLYSSWLNSCFVYESQLQMSAERGEYFCLSLAVLKVQYLIGLKKVRHKFHKDGYQESFRSCLESHDLMRSVKRGEEKYYSLIEKEGGGSDLQQKAKDCRENALNNFIKDQYVKDLVESPLVRELVKGAEGIQELGAYLHKEGAKRCLEASLSFNSKECDSLIQELFYGELLLEKRAQRMMSKFTLLDDESFKEFAQSTKKKWRSCLEEKGETAFSCGKNYLLSLEGHHLVRRNLKIEGMDFNYKLNFSKYDSWVESYKDSYLECLEKQLDDSANLKNIVTYYESESASCKESASLGIYPLAYAAYIDELFIEDIKALEPHFWESQLSELENKMRKALESGEIRNPQEMKEKIRNRLTKDYANSVQHYISFLKEGGALSQSALNELKRELRISSTQEVSVGIAQMIQRKSLAELAPFSRKILNQVHRYSVRQLWRDKGLSVQVKGQLKKMSEGCLDDSSYNDTSLNYGHYVEDCRKRIAALVPFLSMKEKLEHIVKQVEPLKSERAKQILSPIWYARRCIDDLPFENLRREEYVRRSVACTSLASLDIFEKLIFNFQVKGRALLGDENKTSVRTGNVCIEGIYSELSERYPDSTLEKVLKSSGNERLRSIEKINNYRWDAEPRNPLLSYLFPEEHLSSSYAKMDAIQLRRLIQSISEQKDIGFDWFYNRSLSCFEQSKDTYYDSFRERLTAHSRHYKAMYSNSKGETDAEVMRHFMDDELLDLVLKMREQRLEASGASFLSQSEVISSEGTLDAFSRGMLKVSRLSEKGFIFDRENLKVELVIFREELKSGIEWLNSSDKRLRLEELGESFSTSGLGKLIAIAEISSQVYQRFYRHLIEMEDEELREFKSEVGYRSDELLSKKERERKEQIALKYQKLQSLIKEMTSSYDFKRIIGQGGNKGQELLDIMTKEFILPSFKGLETTTDSYERAWKLIGELILEDQSAGGFSEKFVGLIAQDILNQKQQETWALTRVLFYNEDDFNWDEMRTSKTGRKAIDYYTRYLILPKILNQNLRPYAVKLREAEFKRYLRDAQKEI